MKTLFNLLFLLAIAKPGWSQTYQLAAESEISFEVKHMGVFNVDGKFTEFSGNLYYSWDSLTGSGTILAKTVTTGNKSRDKDLKATGIFDVENFPEIKFEVISTVLKDDETTMTGRLTIKEKSLDLTFPYDIVQTGQGVLIEFETVVDRTEFDLYFDSLDGLVGNEVKLYSYLLFEPE